MAYFGETCTKFELAPEGSGYRARTRFANFFNLPELMCMFKEVADIKTSDELNLPTPKMVYETVVMQPTEIQEEMVQDLAERAKAVHARDVDPSVDNMLSITNDGRKLGLDQRLINPLLPDDERSKVNACVNNVYRIWQDGTADKLTQLIFCDLSTPKPKANNNSEKVFNVYDDIRGKLIALGVPKEQVAFIHEANSEVQKKELFSKVRSGDVRVLLGSTAKCGAGMNIQDRLVALHDLDAPWRPGDLRQRSGRIERQGNMNETAYVYRYVTEATFDSYLYQTLEKKQNFISQIMTSKSPVRECEDIDEATLSYAEIKALCAGNPLIKERMDLDVEVAKLKLLKANHQSIQYKLEDKILKYFPQNIERQKGYIKAFEQDMITVEQHKVGKDEFSPMTIKGMVFEEKKVAGLALLKACKELKRSESVTIGSYKGFEMSLSYSMLTQEHMLTLKGEMSHSVSLGNDERGNLVRIENCLYHMQSRLEKVHTQLESLYKQQESAKAELGKPFTQADELKEKSSRLAEIDAILNMENTLEQDSETQENEEVSAVQKDSELEENDEVSAVQTKTPTQEKKPSIIQALKSKKESAKEKPPRQNKHEEVR